MSHSDDASMSPHSGSKVNEVCMKNNPSPGQREVCNSLADGMRFCQIRQSRLEQPGVCDRKWGCC